MKNSVLLTFLGTGNYQPVRYRIGDFLSDNETYFSAALASCLKPDRIISLETREASDKHGSPLHDRFSQLGLNHAAIAIPNGASEAELWEIFSALTCHVPEGCTLHLDITHGFRSLPLLGFLGLSYLRVTRKVTIGGIHYGAWEARDETNLAPAFNLTPFLTLLDWTAAADQFLSTGSAARLGDMLGELHQQAWLGGGDQADLPKKLKNLGGALSGVSANLLLLRTGELASSAKKLSNALSAAHTEVASHAAPFLEVLGPVQSEFSRFADTDLSTLCDLIVWLADRGQTAAALTLASEWLTSYVMVACGQTVHHAGYDKRLPFSQAIALLETPDFPEPSAASVENLASLKCSLDPSSLDLLAKTASTIRHARNDLNHAGFTATPASAGSLVRRAREVAADLASLPLPASPPT